jgi:3,4-dihydroxy 2-butanone 4-phosphate synthase/GTP cyclohydrolase II
MPHTHKLAKIEEIIADAKMGKMFILVDDENRENEGDLVIPAEKATPEVVNFMAKFGRGLICLALNKKRVETLGLPLMAQHNGTRHQTAFTVSIESREGVTTGISAADRAKTIATAIDENKGKYDIVTPGHVFPLVAREGGVLVRAGHTEASVDIAKLAGLNASGVICEIMSEDGTMARLPELIEFAEKHNLKIATIADLIEYRRKNEKLIERISETTLETDYAGDFKLIVYKSKLEYAEHIALVKGDISKDKALVRMHQLDILADVLSAKNSPKADMLKKSMQIINQNGSGVVVLLRTPDKQNLSRSIEGLNKKPEKIEVKSAIKPLNSQLRDYGIGAQILLDLGVKNMELLTNSDKPVIALDGYGLEIIGLRKII